MKDVARTTLIHLPVEAIVHIFRFCTGRDILHCGEAFKHEKIDSAIENQSLWRNCDIGPENLRVYLKHLGSHTNSVTIRGFVKLAKKGSARGKGKNWEVSEQLSPSVIESIRLRCPSLKSLTLLGCVFDVTRVRISLFPRTLTRLHFNSVVPLNLPEGARQAVTSSPFHCITKHLPQLASLKFTRAPYLRLCDGLAVLSGCKRKPQLNIEGEEQEYLFLVGEEMGRGSRRETGRHFRDLIDYHHTKKSYNTRALPPQ